MGNCLRLGISRIGLAWTKRRMKTTIKRNTISLLILGTQAGGKTTIALRLWKYKRMLPDLNYVQTKGFNTYTIRRKNKSAINLYDLGGHPSIQELWGHYYADAHGVIFVVDVSNQQTLADAGLVFSQVLNDERIRGKPVLLLANKQDLGGASEGELDSIMNLQEVVNAARCLTRLDESSATDLKNDKGIFEGFRWLVSYIEKNYAELNDRVMHDILEEKNREKARRAEAQAELGRESHNEESCKPNDAPPLSRILLLPSRTFVREESSMDLDNNTVGGNDVPQSHGLTGVASSETDFTPGPKPTTNYLIRSRPNSSLGEPTNPFLTRKSAFSMSARSRRSLPAIHSPFPYFPFNESNKLTSDLLTNHFIVQTKRMNNGGGGRGEQVTNEDKQPNLSELDTAASAPVSSENGSGTRSATPTRLSPEGAADPSYVTNRSQSSVLLHDVTQKLEIMQQERPPVDDNLNGHHHQYGEDKSVSVADLPSVEQVSSSTTKSVQPSPEKFPNKLVRTESSDTEKAGEILMVTTLAQVHQDHFSKGRRGSNASTHESVALSLSSFKSEDTNSIMEEEQVSSNNPAIEPQSLSRGFNNDDKHLPPTTSSSKVPVRRAAPSRNMNVFRVSEHSSTSKYNNTDQGRVKHNPRFGKNKTGPLLPTTSSSSATDNRSRNKDHHPVASNLKSKGSRENVFNASATNPHVDASTTSNNSGKGKGTLLKRNMTSFSIGTNAEPDSQNRVKYP